MKHLKSSLRDLRRTIGVTLTAPLLAEPFATFDVTQPSEYVRAFLVRRDYDVAGVRRDGQVCGYVLRDDLADGVLGDHVHEFAAEDVFHDDDAMGPALDRLATTPRVFVRVLGEVGGIITKGDLQKAPLRMWLFALISVLEMQTLRLIRAEWPANGWTTLLTQDRVAKAEELLASRCKRNEAIDLADCLQFGDKKEIVAGTPALLEKLALSKTQCKKVFKDLQDLRDELAHAQDILGQGWDSVLKLARTAEQLIERCEGVDER